MQQTTIQYDSNQFLVRNRQKYDSNNKIINCVKALLNKILQLMVNDRLISVNVEKLSDFQLMITINKKQV